MLAVAPVDAGRSWGLLSTDSSMLETARAWITPALPAAVPAEPQVAQGLPDPRGSLVARRRQSQAPHRRNGSSFARAGGSWKTTGVGGGGGGGSAVIQGTSSSEGVEGAEGGSGGHASVGEDSADACSSSVISANHLRPQERGSRDPEPSSRSQRGSNSSGGSGGTAGRVAADCGEAWGATSSVTAARTLSDRTNSGGTASSRGGKSSSAPEVWAWAGAGGSTARGKAILSAYGLHTDKHSPICPRGASGDGVARHGRWQRDQECCGARRGESAGSAGSEGGGEKVGGAEGGGGAGQVRSRCGGGGSGRAGDSRLDRVSASQVQRFRVGKSRKQRPTAAPQARSVTTSDQRSLEDRSASYTSSSREQRVAVATVVPANVCDGGSRRAGQAPAPIMSTLGDDRGEEGLDKPDATATSFDIKSGSGGHAASVTVVAAEVNRRPAEHIQRALEDLLVHPRSSKASPLHQSGCAVLAEVDSSTSSRHVAILSMDGRGGSAAPPHRPQRMALRTVTSASHAPVLPDLGTGTGTSMAGGAGTIPASDAASSSCGDTDAQGGGGGGGGSGGGDDHSTPPVSRQRSHSHHSPWQSRKHPRGFSGSGGRGRAALGRRLHHSNHHSHGHPHERSLFEERLTFASATGEVHACSSSESAERGFSADPACLGAAGAAAGGPAGACAHHPSSGGDLLTMVVANAASVDEGEDASGGAGAGAGNVAIDPSSESRESRAGYGRPTSCGDTVSTPPKSTSTAATVTGCSSDHPNSASSVRLASRRHGGGQNSFDRLLHSYRHSGGGGGSGGGDVTLSAAAQSNAGGSVIVVTPSSELIDHFKTAKRPASRRGTRVQGGGEGEGDGCGWGGEDFALPEPAFCLFSRRGVSAGGSGGGGGGGGVVAIE